MKGWGSAPKPKADIVSDGEGSWWTHGNTWSISDTVSGQAVNQDTLMTCATCYACTMALSETLAGLPGNVYRTMSSKRELDAESDAALLLADQPNPEMDAFTFWELAATRVSNRGNFFAEIERDQADRPKALWPIHNSRVTPLRDPKTGELYFQVARDFVGEPMWQDPSWRQANLFYLSPRNMFNVVGFNSQNGVIAPGMLPAAHEVSMDFAMRKYGGDFFNQGARPSGIVEHPGFIDNEQKRTLFRRDLNEIHNVKDNAHKVGVLWGGAVWKSISVDLEQAQFLEGRKFTSEQLCKFYGVPPAIIGDYKDSKFATADAMIRAFVMIRMRNFAVRFEKAINRQILRTNIDGKLVKAFTKPQVFEFALDGLLRGDPATQAKVAVMLRETGILSTNQVLQEFDYNPIEGEEGEMRIVKGGMVQLKNIDNQGTRLQQADKSKKTDPNKAATKAAAMVWGKAKGVLTETLDRLAQEAKGTTTVRGIDHKEALTEAIIEIAEDAVERIHKITLTQIERWREQDPKTVESKLENFFVKQEMRLCDALMACDKLASKEWDIAPVKMSTQVAIRYGSQFKRLDSHTIFDATNKLNVAETVKEILCSC